MNNPRVYHGLVTGREHHAVWCAICETSRDDNHPRNREAVATAKVNEEPWTTVMDVKKVFWLSATKILALVMSKQALDAMARRSHLGEVVPRTHGCLRKSPMHCNPGPPSLCPPHCQSSPNDSKQRTDSRSRAIYPCQSPERGPDLSQSAGIDSCVHDIQRHQHPTDWQLSDRNPYEEPHCWADR